MDLHKPKILIIPGYLLYPYETGAGLAQYNFIDAVRHELHVSVLISPVNVKDKHIQSFESKWPNVTIHYWRKPAQTVPEKPTIVSRIRNKIENVWKSPENNDIDNEGSEKYNRILYNIENILNPSPTWMVNQLENLLNEHEYDLVQMDLPINIGLAGIVGKRSKTLFVHHEIKFKRIRTMINDHDTDIEQLTNLQKRVQEREMAQLNDFDAVQVFTEEDRLELAGKVKIPIHVCPFSISDGQFRVSDPNEQFQRLIFIGSDEHEPNLDGFKWLLEQWLPQMKSTVPVKLHVLGKWSDVHIAHYSTEMIHFEGYVESLSTWWPNSILIAPIRQGAGLRTKIMEAMSASVPVITTAFAMQGIPANDALDIAENGTELGKILKFYLKDNEAFKNTQQQVFGVAKEHFSASRIIDKRLKIIDKTLTKHHE